MTSIELWLYIGYWLDLTCNIPPKKAWRLIPHGESDLHCHLGEKILSNTAYLKKKNTENSRLGFSLTKQGAWNQLVCSLPFLPRASLIRGNVRLEDRKDIFVVAASGTRPTSFFPRVPSPGSSLGRGQEVPIQHRFAAGNRLELIPSQGCLFWLKYCPLFPVSPFSTLWVNLTV